jgi:surfactin synthase thioesterase subunit
MLQTNLFITPRISQKPKLRLICFPYAGGNASTYLPWAKWLPKNVELVAVQPPGRSSRISEKCHSNMESYVNEVLLNIRKIVDIPYILFGHSLGSRVAFEVMVQCNKLGLPLPQHFIASGSKGPHVPLRSEPIHELPDDEFITKLVDFKGTAQEVLDNKELLELFMPMLRADFKLSDTYNHSSKLKFDCPITVIGGKSDLDVTRDDLNSWAQLFTYEADIHIVPGDHFFIDNQVEFVARKITCILKGVTFI